MSGHRVTGHDLNSYNRALPISNRFFQLRKDFVHVEAGSLLLLRVVP